MPNYALEINAKKVFSAERDINCVTDKGNRDNFGTTFYDFNVKVVTSCY